MFTRDDVIKSRQGELVNEIFDIERQMEELTSGLERLSRLKELRIMEHRLLDDIGDRGVFVTASEKTRPPGRLPFEDCLVQMYDRVGRPMRMQEIIEELDRFGYQWSDYHKAYTNIRRSHLVQPTGARGHYNIIRTRGW